MKNSFTYMSDEALTALRKAIVAEADKGQKLNLELVAIDSLALISVLKDAANDGDDWAGNFLSDLASTYDHDWV